MMKSIGKLALATILAALVVGVPMGALADGTNAAPAAKTRGIPFNGKIGAVDTTNKTLTLDQKTKRTFQITADTKIMKMRKPAMLADAVVGDNVSGYYTKDADGKLTAKSIFLGGKPATATAPAPPAPK